MARRKKTVTFDFSRAGKAFEPGQEVLLEIDEVEVNTKRPTKKDPNPYPSLKIKLVGVEDEFKNSVLYHNLSTSPQSGWSVRPFFEALGLDVDDENFEIDPGELEGMQIIGVPHVDRYTTAEGESKRSIKCDEWYSAEGVEPEEADDDDEDEDEDEKPKGRRGKGKDKKETKPKRGRGKKEEEEDEDEDEGDEDEDEDEGEEDEGEESDLEPIASDEVKEMTEEELEDLVEEYELDVNLKKAKTLRRKRGAVIDALEEMDLLDD